MTPLPPQQARKDGKTMDDESPMDVKAIMDTWTLQMNFPVVMVTRDYNDASLVHVTQDRYLVNPDAEDPGKYTSEYG